MANVRGQFLKVHKVFWKILSELKDQFWEPKMLLETTFLKEGQHFRWKTRNFGHFCSYYWEWQTSEKKIWGFTRYTERCFGSNMIIFSGPNCCLKHNFHGKKGCFSSEIFFRPTFLSLRSLKNFKEHFTRVHGVFWQIFFKL